MGKYIDFQYDDGGRSTAGFQSKKAGDCVCRAIVIATGRPYREVYDRLAQGHASQRRSKGSARKQGVRTASHGIYVKRKWFKDYMAELGFTWTPTMKIGQGAKVHLRREELPEGRLVVSLSRHYAAVIDRVVRDTYLDAREGRRCVYGYWTLKVGVEEGDKCNRWGCEGKMKLEQERCYCNVTSMPPCAHCEGGWIECDSCGAGTDD